jgi:hypothetical protein
LAGTYGGAGFLGIPGVGDSRVAAKIREAMLKSREAMEPNGL